MMWEGIDVTAQMILAKILRDNDWPFYQMNSISCGICAVGVLSGLRMSQISLPRGMGQWIWAASNGAFATTSFVTSILAVQLGTPLGDVASLMSINIVVAAFLGRAFLGEALKCVHFLALACSVCGAVLISQPPFLFGGAAADASVPWLGYLLA